MSIRHQQRQLESACMSKLLNEITNNAGQTGKSEEVQPRTSDTKPAPLTDYYGARRAIDHRIEKRFSDALQDLASDVVEYLEDYNSPPQSKYTALMNIWCGHEKQLTRIDTIIIPTSDLSYGIMVCDSLVIKTSCCGDNMHPENYRFDLAWMISSYISSYDAYKSLDGFEDALNSTVRMINRHTLSEDMAVITAKIMYHSFVRKVKKWSYCSGVPIAMSNGECDENCIRQTIEEVILDKIG